MGAVLALTDGRGRLKKSSLEAVCLARQLAAEKGHAFSVVHVSAYDSQVRDALAQHGVPEVAYSKDPELAKGNAEAAMALAGRVARAKKAGWIILAASFFGKELAGLLSGELGGPAANDCLKVSWDGDQLMVTRPVYAGKVLARLTLSGSPQIYSIRPNQVAVSAEPAPIQEEEVPLEASALKVRVLEEQVSGGKRPELTEAEVIVSGGRGIKAPENFTLIESLADVLGAAAGASRAIVDAGWRPHSDQVGQTGKVVSPKLYIACGISGAIQHYAGMGSSKIIVAVNKDKEAPIFKKCDYGIVGDLFEVVPALKETFEREKKKRQ